MPGIIKQRPTWGTSISPGSREDARNTPGPIEIEKGYRGVQPTINQQQALNKLYVEEVLKKAREEKMK